jgi:hypothetical protein
MKISELIKRLTEIREEHGDLSMARTIDYNESDSAEQGYDEAYTYSFSHPVVIPVIEQNYSGYIELQDVTGGEMLEPKSKKVVTLG